MVTVWGNTLEDDRRMQQTKKTPKQHPLVETIKTQHETITPIFWDGVTLDYLDEHDQLLSDSYVRFVNSNILEIFEELITLNEPIQLETIHGKIIGVSKKN